MADDFEFDLEGEPEATDEVLDATIQAGLEERHKIIHEEFPALAQLFGDDNLPDGVGDDLRMSMRSLALRMMPGMKPATLEEYSVREVAIELSRTGSFDSLYEDMLDIFSGRKSFWDDDK